MYLIISVTCGIYRAKLKLSCQVVTLKFSQTLADEGILGYHCQPCKKPVSLLLKYLQMNTDNERKDSRLTESPEAADFYG